MTRREWTTEHYDRVGRLYDRSRAANPKTVKRLVRLLQVNGSSMLLELGCGTGNYAAALEREAGSVVGIDISRGMISQVSTKSSELALVCGDVTSLPFHSNTFDGSIAMHVIHHVCDRRAFLDEVHRVLREGGKLAIHTCSHEQSRHVFWIFDYFPEGLEADIARMPDVDEICGLLQQAGFSNVGVETCFDDYVVVNERPESYLDKDYRDGISTFALMSQEQLEAGCDRLRRDIASGEIESVIRRALEKLAEFGGSVVVYGQKNPTG